ncbi:MAG: CCDC90 family protein [Magnetococcus sp. MYC-9]
MATVTFDTLELVDRLKAAGFQPEQAEEVVRVIAKSHDELVTRRDLQVELAPLKWGMAVTVGGIITIILKSFFPH